MTRGKQCGTTLISNPFQEFLSKRPKVLLGRKFSQVGIEVFRQVEPKNLMAWPVEKVLCQPKKICAPEALWDALTRIPGKGLHHTRTFTPKVVIATSNRVPNNKSASPQTCEINWRTRFLMAIQTFAKNLRGGVCTHPTSEL